MRKLESRDLFAAMRVIKVSGARHELMQIIKEADEDDVEGTGILGVLAIMEALSGTAAEKEIYKCIADIAEKGEDDIEHMPPADFLELLNQIAANNDMKSFFAELRRLIGRKR